MKICVDSLLKIGMPERCAKEFLKVMPQSEEVELMETLDKMRPPNQVYLAIHLFPSERWQLFNKEMAFHHIEILESWLEPKLAELLKKFLTDNVGDNDRILAIKIRNEVSKNRSRLSKKQLMSALSAQYAAEGFPVMNAIHFEPESRLREMLKSLFAELG